ncbi:phosphoribosylanthranilate isomerase [Bacillus horti]|uniref:N-(5'-phosphoribosyl)anthranilate isomerase n=1 Tax=Caldalkalibacillus horti TaxID=77523 RepID=A0ABT9VWW8_9BACI|nr:phosphoribosylanthranilate isomerase [Bacillus horti]MDQ0165477.1 phosphoribosylanthranilate isomerase [Bacillus horti]
MSRAQLKICGNQSWDDLKVLQTYGDQINHVGFIFTKQSKRVVSAEQVSSWLEEYPSLLEKAVAVFLNQEADEILQILGQTGIQTVQLHGNESLDTVNELIEKHRFEMEKKGYKGTLSIWKVLHVHTDVMKRWDATHNQGIEEVGEQAFVQKVEQLQQDIQTWVNHVDAFLLDTQVKGSVGGTGMRFDWRILPLLADFIEQLSDKSKPLWIAGGVRPENVEELIQGYGIRGIDIASGAEVNGKKDALILKRLIERMGEENGTGAVIKST